MRQKFIAKCNRYCEVQQLFQSATVQNRSTFVSVIFFTLSCFKTDWTKYLLRLSHEFPLGPLISNITTMSVKGVMYRVHSNRTTTSVDFFFSIKSKSHFWFYHFVLRYHNTFITKSLKITCGEVHFLLIMKLWRLQLFTWDLPRILNRFLVIYYNFREL